MSVKTQYFVLLLTLAAFFSGSSQAQIAGGNVFIKANYLEIGIAPNGAFGSTINAPITYNARSFTNDTIYDPLTLTYIPRPRALGFVADIDKDGWSFGSPNYFGDYFMPGAPQEGFSVQAGGRIGHAWSNFYHRTRGASGFMGAITGSNFSYNNSGAVKTAVWQGNLNNLSIKQTVNLIDTNLYFTVSVVLKNNGASTLNEVYYMRTVDPDNDWAVGNGSALGTTDNRIVQQLPNGNDKVLVCSRGTVHRNAYLGLGTKDCRARVFLLTSGLLPGYGTTLADMYNNLPLAKVRQTGGDTADNGIGIVYNLGNIPAGDSVTLTYAYILAEKDLDDAISQTLPGILYNNTFYKSGDTIDLCQSSTANIEIKNGSFYNWTWTPSVGLSNTSGLTNSINVVGDLPRTYTVRGTSTDMNFCASSKSITITVNPIITPLPVATDVTYCIDQMPSPLIATGTNLLWYTTATGGTGLSTITPSTATAGIFQYYVSQTASGCESKRVPVKVTVHDLLEITDMPESDTVCIDAPTAFKVIAKGSSITYQWQANNGTGFTDIEDGATYTGTHTSLLSIPVASASLNNIEYRCVVNGLCSTAPIISTSATLNVLIQPEITIQPAASIVCNGFDDTLSVTAKGLALSYQWQMGTSNGYINLSDNSVYSGVNTPMLKIVRASGLEAGVYRCIVTNTCLLADTSADASITVSTIANIVQQPANKYVCDGEPVSFEVLTSGDVVRYQWQVNDGRGWRNVKSTGVYTGANNNTLLISAADNTIDSNSYRCVVYGKCITRTSNAANMWLYRAPEVVAQPADATAEYDKPAFFEIESKGVGIKYRWQASLSGAAFVFINDNNLYSGTRTKKLTVKNVVANQNGSYFRCVVEEAGNCNYSGVTSDAARLRVIPPTSIPAVPEDYTFNIYPNPATGNELFIQTDMHLYAAEIAIINSVGQVVIKDAAQLNNSVFSTNISALPPGIYVIRVFGKNHSLLHTQTISVE